MQTQGEKLYSVLALAQQFGVAQALSKCVAVLQSSITVKNACMALDLPSTVLENESVQALASASKSFLVTQFGNFLQAIHRPEFPDLSLNAFIGILESDESMAPVDSENTGI